MDLYNKETKDSSQTNPNKWAPEYPYIYNTTVRPTFSLLNNL